MRWEGLPLRILDRPFCPIAWGSVVLLTSVTRTRQRSKCLILGRDGSAFRCTMHATAEQGLCNAQRFACPAANHAPQSQPHTSRSGTLAIVRGLAIPYEYSLSSPSAAFSYHREPVQPTTVPAVHDGPCHIRGAFSGARTHETPRKHHIGDKVHDRGDSPHIRSAPQRPHSRCKFIPSYTCSPTPCPHPSQQANGGVTAASRLRPGRSEAISVLGSIMAG